MARPQWAMQWQRMGERTDDGRARLQSENPLSFRLPSSGLRRLVPAQQKHRLLAEQVPEPPRRVEAERLAPGVERHRALHLDPDRRAQVAEILDRAEMDVRRV